MARVLGLDIGISSVGWGIIDHETGEIIDAGVRLFEEATRNANEERRSFRGSRRLKRRRVHRLERAKALLESAEFPLDGIGKVNPYQARYNAIYDSVSGEELAAALYHLVKRRGTVLDSPEDDDKNKNELSTKEQLKRNKRLLEGKFICEVQLERLQNKYEKMRNHENRFRTEDYVKEAKAILNQQQKFYPQISNEFINQYIDLIERRRQYYEGPGSEKSPTPYGSYYVDENGQLAYRSMIEKMRGKCFKEFAIDDSGIIVNSETGEILDEDKFFDHAFINFIRNLKTAESKVKYSHKVDRKANRSLSNQTIYGTRKKDGEVFYLGRTPKKWLDPYWMRYRRINISIGKSFMTTTIRNLFSPA